MAFLKAIITLILIFSLTSCGTHKSHETKNPFDLVKEKAEFYMKHVTLENAAMSRCDGVTFRAIYDTLRPSTKFLRHEWPAGKLNRDYDVCFPKDSRSEISREGYINTLHTILTRKDLAFLERLIKYAEANAFVVGRGSYEYTDIKILAPVMYELRNHLLGKKAVDKSLEKGFIDPALDYLIKEYAKYFTGYRAYVVANYIFLRGRINSRVTAFEFQTLRAFEKKNPEDPYFVALVAKYGSGDQQKTIDLLANETYFPFKYPMHSKKFSWEGINHALLFSWVSYILSSK